MKFKNGEKMKHPETHRTKFLSGFFSTVCEKTSSPGVFSSHIAFSRSEKNVLSFDSLPITVIIYDNLLITLLQKIISAETVSVFVVFFFSAATAG